MLKNSKLKTSKTLRQQAEKLLAPSLRKNKNFATTDISELHHELDIHQIELQMQNEALQNAVLQLEKTQKQYLESYEYALVGYLSIDENNRIIKANLTICDLLGIPRTSLINKRFTDFINKDYQDIFFIQCRQTLLTKNKQSCEIKLIKKDDIFFYAYVEIMAVENSAINHNHLQLSIIDITIRKLAEEELRHRLFELNQAAKISALETLSSVLAHELNQPIAAAHNFINGCIRRLEGKTYRKSDILAALKQAKQQTERAGSIIHHLKDFIHKERVYDKIIDINKLIQEVIYLIKQEPLPIKVGIFTQLLKVPNLLLADKLHIELVLLNLIRNSIEAMASANTVNPKLVIQTVKINKDFIKISVSDTGPGITPEASKKLFEPFFTTKPSGLGVGLAICHNIISGYGGELSAKNEDKGGACFEFTLPIAKKVKKHNAT